MGYTPLHAPINKHTMSSVTRGRRGFGLPAEPADCQLHCQPMGHRFYATLAKLVRDGTPCSTGLDDRVCIGGSCLVSN